MKILILSDLHLDANSLLNTFEWDLDEFITSLKNIRHSHVIDKIVLNGDIFDLCKDTYDDIIQHNKRLFDYLNLVNTTFIKGNHDASLPFEESIDIINSKGIKIHIEHGHKCDIINGTLIGRFIGRFFYKILLLFSRLSFVCDFYNDCMKQQIAEFRKYSSHKYLKYATKLYEKYDVIILGHTHKMEYHHTAKCKHYFNCGSCSFGKFEGIVLDTETLEHSMIHIDKPQTKLKLINSKCYPASRNVVWVPA
jgi:predicted phosphodiesterase